MTSSDHRCRFLHVRGCFFSSFLSSNCCSGDAGGRGVYNFWDTKP